MQGTLIIFEDLLAKRNEILQPGDQTIYSVGKAIKRSSEARMSENMAVQHLSYTKFIIGVNPYQNGDNFSILVVCKK
ncbi:hypothetical protein A9239_17205 [Methanosarcina sp. A14]|uniref:hypothetical protein n=1 Tax=Methanosarcina barkeri TaxID=2208 RepID=UPI00064F71EA|nr:hypothetical protein [Methanosarcina barkeri]OEC92706.1 hypothetical protein A9239_17205 [Methanosarcina sp. A14]